MYLWRGDRHLEESCELFLHNNCKEDSIVENKFSPKSRRLTHTHNIIRKVNFSNIIEQGSKFTLDRRPEASVFSVELVNSGPNKSNGLHFVKTLHNIFDLKAVYFQMLTLSLKNVFQFC